MKELLNNIEHNSETIKTTEWTDKVVYEVYCNDNLEELPIGILEQMNSCIGSVIESKKEKGVISLCQ